MRHAAAFLGRTAVALVVLVGFPSAGGAQVRDAALPPHGTLELWLEPEFESWSEQFAEDSPTAGDGERESLAADYRGSIVDRLFPGVDPLLADLNADASALGFAPLAASDVSLGALAFGAIDAERRRIPLAFELGLWDRLAVGVTVPLVRTETEVSFVFDSVAASLVRAEAALDDPASFFSSLSAARTQLQVLVDGGGLTPEDEAAALELLAASGAFGDALEARVTAGGLLPAGATPAGLAVEQRWNELQTGFGGFAIGLPGFALPATVTSADLDAYFRGPPLSGRPFGADARGWNLGEVEMGLRVALLDTFGEPPRRADAAERPAPAAAPAAVADSPVAADSVAVPDSVALPDSVAAADSVAAVPDSTHARLVPLPGGLRLRTTVGARLRLPLSEPDELPYAPPDAFVGVPIGDGQVDVELALYQDLRLGGLLQVSAAVRWGLQLADRLVRRVAPPDRPFAVASRAVEVERDLGDYLAVRIAPRLLLNRVLSVGLEYDWWSKAEDTYTLVDGNGAATPLEVETRETRHRLGIGAYYDATAARALGGGAIPVDLEFRFQTAVAGSGGQTPAAQRFSVATRIPIGIF